MEAMIREVAMFRSSCGVPTRFFIETEPYYSEPYFAREAVVLIESLDTVGDT